MSVIFHLSFAITCFAQNINVSNGIVFDGEPNLAVNPNNTQNLVIAWMSYSLVTRQISLYSSEVFFRCTQNHFSRSHPKGITPWRSAWECSSDALHRDEAHQKLFPDITDEK